MSENGEDETVKTLLANNKFLGRAEVMLAAIGWVEETVERETNPLLRELMLYLHEKFKPPWAKD